MYIYFLNLLLLYSVFIKYCGFFFQEFLKVWHPFLASIPLLLVVQKVTKQWEWLYTCIGFRALKVFYIDVAREGLDWILKNTIFPEHPVCLIYSIKTICSLSNQCWGAETGVGPFLLGAGAGNKKWDGFGGHDGDPQGVSRLPHNFPIKW